MPAANPSSQELISARAVHALRPATRSLNRQTAASNAFHTAPAESAAAEAHELALAKFDVVAWSVRRAGVDVLIVPDTPRPAKPDALFPNNWVSFHFDGTVALYPMLAPNRRCERREDLLDHVVREGGFRIVRTIDLTHRETEGKFLEGTGSVVLDRAHRVAYASLSPRTDLDVLGEFAQLLDYELVTFEAGDGCGLPVYHTNVVMAIGSRFAVVCGESIAQPAHRAAVFDKLRADGHDIVDISRRQMQEVPGNTRELAAAGGPVNALRPRGRNSLEPAQRRILESHAGVIPVAIPTIERIGGGGVRCMLAELHLPKRQ